MSGMRTPLAWFNLTHDRVRFGLFVLGIVFAVTLMFVQLGFRGALLNSNTLIQDHLNGDLVLVAPNRQTVAMREFFPRHRLSQAAGVPGVAAVYPVFVENGLGQMRNTHSRENAAQRQPSRAVRVIGVDPYAYLLNLPELDPQDSRFLGDQLVFPGTALFDRRTRMENADESVFGPLSIGTETELAGQRLRFVGSFALGSDFTSEGTIIVSLDTFSEILRKPYSIGSPMADIDLGLIRVAPGTSVKAVQQELRRIYNQGESEPDVIVLTTKEYVQQEEAFWLGNTPIGFAFGFGMFMGFAVGLVICYQILSGDVADHLPEYATLKAMGYTNLYLGWVVMQEAILLAVCGYAVGLGISWLAYLGLTEATGLPLIMSVERAVSVFIATVLMCILSGFIALIRLLRADPADVFG
jgi:putative ABC transport system permease protein